MKRIAFVSTMTDYPWGGSEELWSQTARRLLEQGVAVSANVRWWPELNRSLLVLDGAGCEIVPRFAPLSRPEQFIRRWLPGRITRRLYPENTYRWLDRFKPDLVVISQGAQLDEECLPWMHQCAVRGIPYAPLAQCAYEFFWPPDEILSEFSRYYEQAAACFFVSRTNLGLARTQLAVPLDKGRVVRNPFKISWSARPEWPDTEKGWHLACVARLEPRAKGQDVLFRVLGREKWRQRPLNVTLFGSGPNEQNLLALQRIHRLDRVTFGGFVTDIEAIWASHHALVLPSRYEGLPLALVEAMLCGRPGIVTDVAGNAELVEDGVTGFVAAAPTEGLLDEALERAWARRDEWRDIGEAAARCVRRMVPSNPPQVFADELLGLL